MKTSKYSQAGYLLAPLVLGATVVGLQKVFAERKKRTSSSPAPRPELEYLEAVNSVAPSRDPQLLFLLMAQYSSANLQGEGADFLSARLKEFESQLTNTQKALYLSAIGLLRAQHAYLVPLLHRIAYVKKTIAILERAKQMSGGDIFVVNWIQGIVRAELPSLFRQKLAAQTELQWCL